MENLNAEIDSTLNDNDNQGKDLDLDLEGKIEKVDKIKKLLSQRNQARKEAETLKQEVESAKKLEKKIAELEERFIDKELEFESKKEAFDFFNGNPTAKSFESDIQKLKDEYNLSYEKAYKLYIAENKPELLLDQQQLNKSNSGNQAISGVTKIEEDKDPQKMSDDEFEKRSNHMAEHSSLYRT